ncbi:hypothetical protein B0H11DRAFT_1898265 [Mycena galericulata]|nr:hypothetical protein B0H11DRAFT_1898265 [Mycena galericulata]
MRGKIRDIPWTGRECRPLVCRRPPNFIVGSSGNPEVNFGKKSVLTSAHGLKNNSEACRQLKAAPPPVTRVGRCGKSRGIGRNAAGSYWWYAKGPEASEFYCGQQWHSWGKFWKEMCTYIGPWVEEQFRGLLPIESGAAAGARRRPLVWEDAGHPADSA